MSFPLAVKGVERATRSRAAAGRLRAQRVALGLLMALTGVGAAHAEAQELDPRLPSVTLPAELDRVLRDYEEAWSTGDGPALAALFTEDGVIRRRSWIRGRDAIRTRYDAVAGGDLRLRAVGFTLGRDAAHVTGAYGYGEAAAERDAGIFVLALERGADGRWLIATDLDHGVPP